MTIKVLLAGLGQVGMGYDYHADSKAMISTHARAIDNHGSFQMVAAVENDATKAQQYERKYRAPVYQTIEDVPADLAIDLAVIATPTKSHLSMVKKCINHLQPKALLCEKPMGTNTKEAEDIFIACNKAKIRIYINYLRRSEVSVGSIADKIFHHEMIGPFKGICWYSKGLFNNASHMLNLLQFWLGKKISVKIIEAGELNEFGDPEPDFLVNFEKGRVFFLCAKEEDFSHYTIELKARNGLLRYEALGAQASWQPVYEDRNFPGYRSLSGNCQLLKSTFCSLQMNVYDAIAAYWQQSTDKLCHGAEALETMMTLDHINERRKQCLRKS